MGDWPPDSVVTVRSREVAATPVHLWIIPADVAGRWTSPSAPSGHQLDLAQRYQLVRGTADSVWLEGVRLHGDSIAFTAEGRRFVGKIAGDEARGTLAVGAAPMPWRAVRVGRR